MKRKIKKFEILVSLKKKIESIFLKMVKLVVIFREWLKE